MNEAGLDRLLTSYRMDPERFASVMALICDICKKEGFRSLNPHPTEANGHHCLRFLREGGKPAGGELALNVVPIFSTLVVHATEDKGATKLGAVSLDTRLEDNALAYKLRVALLWPLLSTGAIYPGILGLGESLIVQGLLNFLDVPSLFYLRSSCRALRQCVEAADAVWKRNIRSRFGEESTEGGEGDRFKQYIRECEMAAELKRMMEAREREAAARAREFQRRFGYHWNPLNPLELPRHPHFPLGGSDLLGRDWFDDPDEQRFGHPFSMEPARLRPPQFRNRPW